MLAIQPACTWYQNLKTESTLPHHIHVLSMYIIVDAVSCIFKEYNDFEFTLICSTYAWSN
jgi:hypothetical protein